MNEMVTLLKLKVLKKEKENPLCINCNGFNNITNSQSI